MAAVGALSEFLCSVLASDKEELWKREFIESGTGRTLLRRWHGALSGMEQ